MGTRPQKKSDKYEVQHDITGIPAIGEKILDFHLLYVEIMNRGGFQKVVESEQWSERSQVLGFFPTSISNYLMETYISLVIHSEQVYFLKQRDAFTPICPAKVQFSPKLPDLNVSILDPTQPDLEEEQIGEKPMSLNRVLVLRTNQLELKYQILKYPFPTLQGPSKRDQKRELSSIF